MRVAFGLVLLLSIVARGAAPATAPTTAASQPARLEPLVGGALRYEAPSEPWKLSDQPQDRFVRYVTEDSQGFLEVAVDDFAGLNETQKQSYVFRLGKALKEQAQKENATLLYGPRAEKDDRFYLKVHDRRKTQSGHIVDRIQIFRTFGTYIVRVAATALASSEDDPQIKQVHSVGEDLLDRMKVTRGVRPTYFPRTQIKIVPPVDWKEMKVDKPNDVTVTYVDERNPGSKIIVRSRVMPKDARTPGAKQEALVAKMIDDERLTAPFTAKATSRDEQVQADDKALKRFKSAGTVDAKPVTVDTRYFILRDTLISIRAISDTADASAVAAIAAKLQEAVAPIRD
jgi:hypothetical protein